MNKKIIYIVAIIVIVAIVGVGVYFASQNNSVEKASSSNAKQEEIFIFNYDNKDIKLADEFSVQKYGKEIEYSEIASCAFEGLDKTYKYDHYEITTFPNGNKDKIFSIYFLDENVSTKEGVKISDSYNHMIEVYGTNYKQEGNVYTYIKGKTKLEFIVENDVITSIEYVYDV